MPDRKKVIKGLECCVWEDPEVSHDCEHCPYIDRCCTENEGIGVPVMRDALALLKEQEAVYPSWQNGKMYCGHCGSKFPPRVMMRFCHRCGVPIKLKVNDIVEQKGR